jgi:cytoskeletal protein CcmA (bactofilin family)
VFGKTRRHQTEIRTLLAIDTRVVGDINFTGGLHLYGRVQGNILAAEGAAAVLSVGSTGVVEGSVEVPEVILNGTVQGDVIAGERVELGPTARVVGNVVYNLIEMAIGAEVNGKLIHRATHPTEATGDGERN